MTGFARVSRSLPSGELTLTIKTVNHKGLDLHFHMPAEFDCRRTCACAAAIRKRIVRGHAQIQVSFKRNAEARQNGAAAINEPLLRAWLDSFRDVAARFEHRFEARSQPGASAAGHDRIARRSGRAG